MTHRQSTALLVTLAGAYVLTYSSIASAQLLIQDDFTQASDSNSWKTFNGACLTAGDGTGSIPACVGLAYYQGQTLYGGYSGKLPDPAGNGALRFTNGNNSGGGFANGFNQAGSIISNFTFPTGQGIQVTFKTVTYRGDSGGGGKDGADGMSFFLMDGSYSPYDTGAFGGSLGYTCSNTNNDPTLRADGTPRQYDGLRGGYIGLGIDEYGNFLNQGDNTATGYGYVPGRIGLRGAGSISWAALNALDNVKYPSTLTAAQQSAAVNNTCKTGFLWDYSNPSKAKQTTTAVADYAAIPNAYKVLTGLQIANEAAVKRSDGTPITYNLKITQDGLLSLSYSTGGSYLPVITKQDIKASNGALPASFRFGFAGSTGGSTNIHEIMCFQATPAELASTSVGIDAKQSAKVTTSTQAFFAYYYPSDWTGRLTANYLTYDNVNKVVGISTVSNWDAQCNLTGVASGKTCITTNKAGPTAAQDPTTRTILTWGGSSGVPFQWTSLTSAQQNALDLTDATPINDNRLKYLRGDRTNEINSSGVGLFRARNGVLADIVDSSPTWVGAPSSPYATAWTDLINSSATNPENGSGAQAFNSYLTGAAATRLNVVYAGANDGLLHGFRSGSFDSSGNFVSTLNDGQEVLAYMPGYVLSKTIHGNTSASTIDSTIDYSNSNYGHNFYVDATPDQDDLFYANTACPKGCWHTWLVGGLGPGGSALYALDVTDPSIFAEKNASSIVIGEWNSSTISCSNVSNCGNNLGNTYGVPVIRRLHNGAWAIIFGNGYGSSTGDAGIYVGKVDPSSGAVSFYYYSTGKNGSNGIAYVSPADLDGDHITDYVYAGDLLGNIWRLDLTSSDPTKWAIGSSPLFTTPSAQPITTKLLLTLVPQATGSPRVMVDFGTGQKIPVSNSSPQSYVTGTQYLFGIWDWNMAGWNKLAATNTQVASLAAPQTVTSSVLTAQTISSPSASIRDVTSNVVCWSGSTTCKTGNTQFGWYVSLPSTNEQVVFNPTLFDGAFVVNTLVPATNTPLNCQANTDTGWTMAIDVGTGAAIKGFFQNYSNDSGFLTNGSGTAFGFSIGGGDWLLTQSTGNGLKPLCTDNSCAVGVNPKATSSKRLTWIQRR